MPTKLSNYLFIAASTVLLISTALYITEDQLIFNIICYAYAVSGAIIAIYYLSNLYQGDNLRLKRLNIQQVIAAVSLPVSSYFMFNRQNEWFAFLLISAFLQIYIVVARTMEEKKEN